MLNFPIQCSYAIFQNKKLEKKANMLPFHKYMLVWGQFNMFLYFQKVNLRKNQYIAIIPYSFFGRTNQYIAMLLKLWKQNNFFYSCIAHKLK